MKGRIFFNRFNLNPYSSKNTCHLQANTASFFKREKTTRTKTAFDDNKTMSLALPKEVANQIESLKKKHDKTKDQSIKDFIILEMVKLTEESIKEHAKRRMDLLFYLSILVYGSKQKIKKTSTRLQHGRGSALRGTDACHSSLFPSINMDLAKTHFADSLNSTMELLKIVNGFDCYLEGQGLPSQWVKQCEVVLNQVSQEEIDPMVGMNRIYGIMHDFFSTSKADYFNATSAYTSPLAKIKVCAYQREGTFQSVNKDLTLRQDYLHLMLRLSQDEIEKVKDKPELILECVKRMQQEILNSPATRIRKFG